MGVGRQRRGPTVLVAAGMMAAMVTGGSTPDPRRWRALAVCLTALAMTLVDATVINVALPSIGAGLGADPSELLWVVAGYALAFGMVPVLGGRLGDDLGRRRVLLTGVAAFVVTSAAVGLAPTAGVLIAARVLQGISGGIINPQVSGIIQSLFSGEERGRAFGALGASVGLATAAGPVIGGLVIGAVGPTYGWRATFLVNVPIGTVSFLLCRRLLPSRAPVARAPARLDLPGLALLSTGLFAVLYPTIQFDSSRDPWLALWWLPAAGLLTAFAVWERGPARRRGQPLVDTGLFAIRSYSAGLGLALLYFSAYAGLPLVLALYLQDGLGLTPLASGLTASAYAVGAGVSAPVAGRFVARLGRRLIVVALVLFVAGVGVLAAVALLAERGGVGSVPWLLAGPLFLAGLGGGAVITPNQALSLARVDARGGSTAGGMLQTAQRIGSATGAAVLSAVFYAGLRSGGGSDGTGAGTRDTYSGAFAIAAGGTVALALLALVVAVVDARAENAARAGGGPTSALSG